MKQISLGALKQLDLDLIQCERTLSKLNVKYTLIYKSIQIIKFGYHLCS